MSVELILIGLALIGIISGFLGGMLGIGGGVVIVPALILVFEAIPTHQSTEITLIAVATSMACIVFTSASAAYTQYRAGKVLWPLLYKLAPVFIIGSFCAGLLTPHFEAWLLRGLIGVFLGLVGCVMIFDWKPSPERSLPGLMGTSVIGITGGLVSGTAGIAGGNVIVPTLTYFNTPIHNATATSSAMGVPIAAFGALGYALGSAGSPSPAAMLGYIDLQAWLWITVAAITSAPIGVRIAHRLPAATLKRCFGILLFGVAARMIYTSVQLAS